MDKSIVTGLVDAAAITVALLAGRFLSPGDTELVKALIVAWQVPFTALALYFAYREHLIVEVRKLELEVKIASLYAAADNDE